jgi:APA family basic amino acid/polyamine antiporter
MICSLIEFLGLALIIILGIFFGGKVNYLEAQQGLKGILSASALIFFAYLGFEELVNIAEETKNPTKNLPKALIFSVVITSIIYVLVSISAVSLANWKDLAASSSPLAYAASVVLGQNAFLIMSTIALFATANTVLVSLIVGSRMIYGMSKDGSLPKILSKVHKKRRTPWIAVFVTMIFSMLFVLLGDIKIVASITDLGVFSTFILVNASLILLRYVKPKAKRPFKTPLNIGKFPVIGLLGLISCSTLLFHLEPITLLYGVGLIFAGVIFYFLLKK